MPITVHLTENENSYHQKILKKIAPTESIQYKVERGFRSLRGKRFGKLTVLVPTTKRQSESIVWLCECTCGNFHLVSSRNLVSGGTRSCGCLHKENSKRRIENLQRGRILQPGEAAFHALWLQYKASAKRKKHILEITENQFKKITKQICFYCGSPPKQEYKGKGLNGSYIYNGVDRVDNTRGYTTDNIVPCCGTCNHAKATMTKEEFLNWVDKVWKHIYE